MRQLFFTSMVLVLAIAVSLVYPHQSVASNEPVTQITLRETSNGRWLVEFLFPEPQSAVQSFDGNGETWQGELLPYTLTVVSTRKIFHEGKWAEYSLTLEPEGAGLHPTFDEDAALTSLALPN